MYRVVTSNNAYEDIGNTSEIQFIHNHHDSPYQSATVSSINIMMSQSVPSILHSQLKPMCVRAS